MKANLITIIPQYSVKFSTVLTSIYFLCALFFSHNPGSEEARRFAHDTHIASILSTTGCLRFSLKMDFEVKTSR